MNKRILEIAKQANMLADFGDDITVGRYSIGGSYEQMEQFAELIVEECMTMCDTVSADYLKHRKRAFDFQDKNIYAEGEAACDIIKYKMKKHFGVKE
jgi:hypothetical protein